MSMIYTWVDGSDTSYRKLRDSYTHKKGVSARERNHGELRYSIKSVRKYMPWYKGQIYIVTPGMKPQWINEEPEIKIINQNDIIPKHLQPTFNTNIIELYLHKIPGITEYFVHMNDDYLINKPLQPTDFFSQGKKFNIFLGNPVINKDLSGGIWRRSVKYTDKKLDQKFGQKSRKFLQHAPYIYHQDMYKLVHLLFKQEISQMTHKFRNQNDLLPPYILLYSNAEISLFPSEFKYNWGLHFQLNKSISELEKHPLYSKAHFICLNDDDGNRNTVEEINNAMEKILQGNPMSMASQGNPTPTANIFNNTDTLYGYDTDSLSLKVHTIQDCLRLCKQKGYSGFVTYQNKAYFKGHSPQVCLQKKYYNKDRTMYLVEKKNQTIPSISMYYINLDSDIERRKFFENNANRLKFEKIVRFAGIDGKTCNPTELKKQNYITQTKVTKWGNLGCYVTHLKLWEKLLLEKNSQYAIIFEDDVKINYTAAEYNQIIQDVLLQLPDDWDFVNLNGTGKIIGKEVGENVVKVNNKDISGTNVGLTNYMIKISSIPEFIKQFKPCNRKFINNVATIDAELRRSFNVINGYFFKQAYDERKKSFINNKPLVSTGDFKSTRNARN